MAATMRLYSQIADQHRLLQRFVQDTVDVFHRFGRKPLWILLGRLAHGIVEGLYHRCVQRLQSYRPQRRKDMQFDVRLVNVRRSRLHTAQIGRCPNIEPLPQRHLAGCMIHAVVNVQRNLLQLLRYLFLRLTGDTALDLLSCAGVKSLGVAGLPVGVGFPVFRCCDLSDGAGTTGSFSCFCTRHIRSFPPRGMYHLHDISRAAVVQVLFLYRRDLLPQELQQGIPRDADLPSNADVAEPEALAASDGRTSPVDKESRFRYFSTGTKACNKRGALASHAFHGLPVCLSLFTCARSVRSHMGRIRPAPMERWRTPGR